MSLDSIVLGQQTGQSMNRGAIETRYAFVAEGLSQNDAAAAVDCDSGNFSRILAAKKLPGRALAVRIAARFGVAIERWDEPAPAPSAQDPGDDEPTAPELPALLGKRRSSAPPPMLADAVDDEEATCRDAALSPMTRPSQRDREDTDPDPRAGEELAPTPKPLTVHDRVSTPSPDVDA